MEQAATNESGAEPLTGTDLVLAGQINTQLLFQPGGLDPIIERIEQEAKSFVPDISTEAGRKEIASLAYKIARSKTALDEMGKKLTDEWAKKKKVVDQERNRVWERMEALQKEIRKPLTEWEDKDKERVAAHESAIETLANFANFTIDGQVITATAEKLAEHIELAEKFYASHQWEEFNYRAADVRERTLKSLRTAHEARVKYEADQAELARLRREEEERKAEAERKRIADEAAEKARKEAEEKAAAEKAELERQAQAERDAAALELSWSEAHRENAEFDRLASEARAQQAEADRLAAQAKATADLQAAQAKAAAELKAAQEKAESDRMAAAAKAKEDADAAAQAERDRLAAQAKADADARAAREADLNHKRTINNEVLTDLRRNGIIEEQAKVMIEAIALGRVRHTQIIY